jgi:imidazolonepropionase-like amidohydrolase
MTGTIEIGKQANLILWDENPMDHFLNLTKGMTVFKDGEVYSSDYAYISLCYSCPTND